ncbi:hypothetical protein GPECTOR_87g400 [Gonium pectorale]|uniref:Alpha-amylase n=1 Tax=Gonium pectorale TaxID=33097 RepID=A0A150G123_GONPE|nr:hypothetical protein GPECTOR_87g400 [Gonium pectorale]|eukprot:KXZ43538.1 hypothetical protein GPECTOR_87g400 [Gonium pectorale]
MPGQLYNLDSKYGSKEQLLRLTQALKLADVKPVADIVINHRCADEMDNGVYNRYRDDIDHQGRRIDWGKWAITCNDPAFQGSGNPDTGDDYGPAPDLDHANPELRAALKEWLAWLQRDVGFAGWRLDFARGYAARFVTEYVDATTGPDSLNVGEFWVDLQWSGSHLEYNQDAARQRLCDWIRANGERSCAFDFPTKGLLQEAVKHTQYDRLRDGQGKAPGLLGWWPGKAVTFVENHDTGSTQQHWPFPSSNVGIGSCAFDFPTKGLLQEAVKHTQYDRLRDGQGKAPGLLGWWPGKAVTFVENHDTGSTQQHWPFPSSNVGIGYAYILTHPGIPCVFWDHMFDWGDDLRRTIVQLAALRRRAGIVADSSLEILVAERDLYVARVGGRLTVKMGPRFEMGHLLPREADGWKFAVSGKDWAVWERQT